MIKNYENKDQNGFEYYYITMIFSFTKCIEAD